MPRGRVAHLVVGPRTPVALQAAEGPLDLPAPGLDLEPLAAGGADQFGGDAMGTEEGGRIIAGEGAIQPNQQQGGEPAPLVWTGR